MKNHSAILLFFSLIFLFTNIFMGRGIAAIWFLGEDNKPDSVLVYNPKPLSDDLELPMPHGLKMIFRAVNIPSHGHLFDTSFPMGILDASGVREIYERRFEAHISAPFTTSDLPASWIEKMQIKEQDASCYYFIAKYEISNAQWAAIMEDKLPEASIGKLPKSNIYWFDLQVFIKKYNEWLLSNHLSSVPSIDGIPGYLRLPTEEEWEFAARGGNLPPEQMEFDDFPRIKGTSVKDYAVFGAEYSEPVPIGSKMPNLVGIHDMAGNLAEIVHSAFRFTIADFNASGIRRLHGSTGGILCKGGSFLSSEEIDVYPGKRLEISIFSKSQKVGDNSYHPHKSRTIGARLAIATLNIPSAKRSLELEQEYEKFYRISEKVTSSKDALSIIEEAISSSKSDVDRNRLLLLKGIVKDGNIALMRERDANLLGTVRATVYNINRLRDLAFRCWYSVDSIQKQGSVMSSKELKEAKKTMRVIFDQLDAAVDYYKLGVQDLSLKSEIEVDAKCLQIEREYSKNSPFSKNISSFISIIKKHVSYVRTNGSKSLKNFSILQDTIPKLLLQPIQEELKGYSKK